MAERQQYYRELLEYILDRYYEIEIDPTKYAEAPLPNVRIDMLFEISKEKLHAPSPLPFLTEVNIVHIKAVNDRLTREDIIQYLGELYILAINAWSKNKTISLSIITAEKITKSIPENLQCNIKPTKEPWIYEIEAEVPARLIVLDELPKKGNHVCFLPFQSLSVLEAYKETILQIDKLSITEEEKTLMFFWLKKLQPDFYKREISMKIDMNMVAREIYPDALDEAKNDGIRETIMNILSTRFDNVSEEIKNKINEVRIKETLVVLSKAAVTVSCLDEFQKQLP